MADVARPKFRSVDSRPIVFGPGDKLMWLEAIAVHKDTTDLDARVAIALTNRVDKHTAIAVVSQGWIASEIHCSERAVRESTTRLKGIKIIEVTTGGGRHRANEYKLLKPGASLPGFGQQTRQMTTINPADDDHKPGSKAPPLPKDYLISSGNPAPSCHVSGPPEWIEIRKELVSRLGSDVVASYFDVAEISTDGETATFVAKSRFARSQIETSYGDALRAAWRSVVPSVTRVRIISPVEMRAAE